MIFRSKKLTAKTKSLQKPKREKRDLSRQLTVNTFTVGFTYKENY
jgi:hypothetical protein